MPKRKRAQEAKRQQRRVPPESVSVDLDLDREWREHQEYEALRRSPVPLDAMVRREQARERTRAQVLRALSVVEADFARWRHEYQ